jgi:hypothetical protein
MASSEICKRVGKGATVRSGAGEGREQCARAASTHPDFDVLAVCKRGVQQRVVAIVQYIEGAGHNHAVMDRSSAVACGSSGHSSRACWRGAARARGNLRRRVRLSGVSTAALKTWTYCQACALDDESAVLPDLPARPANLISARNSICKSNAAGARTSGILSAICAALCVTILSRRRASQHQ